MASMRELRIEEASHAQERRTPMRLDATCFKSSRIGVRRSVPDQGHLERNHSGSPLLLAVLCLILASVTSAAELSNSRPPRGDADLAYWLRNMSWHRFTPEEMGDATGLNAAEVKSALRRLGLENVPPPKRLAGAPLIVLPYPGGRHPRI